MALAAQALEAKKAWKPLEQGGALERVAARIKRVKGLTPAVSCAGAKRRVPTGGACWRQLDQTVRLGSGGSLLHLISPMFLLIAVHNQHPKAQPLK